MKFVDLHSHTINSDGTNTPFEVLQLADKIGLFALSITDHDNCDTYFDEEFLSSKRKVKLLRGIEIRTCCLGVGIELLGYGYNRKMMKNEVPKLPTVEDMSYKILNLLVDKAKKIGVQFDIDVVKNYSLYSNLHESKYFKICLEKHATNISNVEDIAFNCSSFYRECMGNVNSQFYIDMSQFTVPIETVVNIIKKCGGKVFVPHIFKYRDKSYDILKKLQEFEIDGIECYHNSFGYLQINELLELCKKNNYFISGGSDFHGKNKPDVRLGVGKGNLKIPYIETKWINDYLF